MRLSILGFILLKLGITDGGCGGDGGGSSNCDSNLAFTLSSFRVLAEVASWRRLVVGAERIAACWSMMAEWIR